MMKKIIQIFLAIFLAIPVIGQTVKLEEVKDAVPGTVSVDLELLGFTGTNGNIGAVSLYIEFNNSLLTYTGPTMINVHGGNTTINPTGNILNIIWVNSIGTDLDGLFLELQFDYTGGFFTELKFVGDNEIANVNLYYIENITYVDGSITPINDVDGYLDIGNMPNAIAGNPAVVPVTIVGDPLSTRFEEVTSMTLYIAIDPLQLTFVNLLNNTYGFTAGYDDGIISLVWSSTTPEDFSNLTTLFDLNFNYEGGGDAAVDFSDGTIVTSGVDVLNIMVTGGTVAQDPDLEQKAIIGDVYVCSQDSLLPIEVYLPVSFEAMPYVGAFNFVIEFDPAVVVYNGLANYHANIASLSVNLTGGNTLNILWSNYSGVDLNGKLFDIKFEFIESDCDVVFKGGSIVKKADATTIPTSFINGSVNNAIKLDLKVFLEGLYAGGGMMNEAKDHDGTNAFPKWGAGIADKITVELRDAADYNALIYSDDEVMLMTDGTATVYVPVAFNGTYWLTIKHRNHLETVGAVTITLESCEAQYDFTTGAGQAYGNNQKDLGDGNFAIFAGDVDGDDAVNIFDRGDVIIALLAGDVGYIFEDLDGDGTITIFDRGLVIIALGRISITP